MPALAHNINTNDMKRIRIMFFGAAAALFFCGSAPEVSAWGKREHAAIAYIAEQNLSPKAAKAVSEILEGRKMSSYASWLDYYKQQMLMKLTEPQNGKMLRTIPHTFQVDSSLHAYRYPEHSCITVIEESMEKLRHSSELNDSTRTQCLLNIIHLTGDMHCPGHVIYDDQRDRHIGKFDVVYRGQTVLYHKVWDSMVTGETFAGGIQDLAYFAMTSDKKTIKEFCRGTVYDWGTDTAASSCGIWKIQNGEKLPATYMYDYSGLALSQIEKAGYRLATLLNTIFR